MYRRRGGQTDERVVRLSSLGTRPTFISPEAAQAESSVNLLSVANRRPAIVTLARSPAEVKKHGTAVPPGERGETDH